MVSFYSRLPVFPVLINRSLFGIEAFMTFGQCFESVICKVWLTFEKQTKHDMNFWNKLSFCCSQLTFMGELFSIMDDRWGIWKFIDIYYPFVLSKHVKCLWIYGTVDKINLKMTVL